MYVSEVNIMEMERINDDTILVRIEKWMSLINLKILKV